jgi:hypothetical protein
MQPEDVADEVRARLAAQQARGAELRAIADLLPTVVRDWQVGVPASTSHPSTEFIAEHNAQWAFWDELLARSASAEAQAVFLDLGMLFELLDRQSSADAAASPAGVPRSRVLTHAESLTHLPAGGFAVPGIELRTIASAPGWLFVEPGSLAVLPLHWDDPTPETIVVTREPVVVDALAAFFEDLWRASSPLPEAPAEWAPVLTLLGQGLSDGAIAASLGLSIRTVRRRIAEASAELGVASRFALGAAWERRE